MSAPSTVRQGLRRRPASAGAACLPRTVLGWFALALLTIAAPTTSLAQDRSPTRSEIARESIDLTTSRIGRSVRADAQSAALNPAILPLVEVPNLDYTVAASDAFASGHGIYGALPLFDVLGLGAAIEFLGDDINSTPLRRYRLGIAGAIGRWIGVGLNYTFFGSEHSVELDELDSIQLGVTTRAIPGLVLSAVVDHVNTPRLEDTWLEPVWHLGAGSALFDGRLKLDAVYSTGGLRNDRFDGSIIVEPIDGLEVFTDTTVQDHQGRWGGGLEVTIGNFGVHAAAYGISSEQDPVEFDGVTGGITFYSQPLQNPFVRDERWVRLAVPGRAPERSARSPFGYVGPSFYSVVAEIDAIRRDPSVHGLVLELDGVGYGYSQLYELRRAVERLRASGTRVVAHLDSTSMRAYYLASAADALFISPGQTVAVRGLSSTLTFYGGALDLLGIDPQFVKIDEYKTAPDAYLRREPTEPHVEQLDDYLDAVFGGIVEAVASSRSLDAARVRALVDLMPMRPDEAIAAGLIDATAYDDEIADEIATHFDLETAPTLEEGYTTLRRRETAWSVDPKVAVIYIDGTIAKGQSIEVPLLGTMTTGSETIVELLDWARTNESVLGVVLRVDSPGGSAHASDLIHHSLERFAAKKPLVVSMGNIAASGGYYVVSPAEKVFATPMTLTGSIGIFAGKVDLSGLLSAIGIESYTFKRGAFADIFSSRSSWNDEERAQMMDQISYLYSVFVRSVAKGRDLDESVVRSVAEGRVWTGEAALDRGLVDEIGGVYDAVQEVKSRAGLASDDTVLLAHLPQRSVLSAYEIALPIDIVGADTSAEASPPPFEPVRAHLIRELVGRVVGWAGVPTSVLLSPDEPLMILPYDIALD